MTHSKKIAVLGAGPMGLAVAYQLACDGYQPVVFEADDRLGGMTASFDFSGVDIERYYHFHCTSDLAFLQLLNELGIADQMHWVEEHAAETFLPRHSMVFRCETSHVASKMRPIAGLSHRKSTNI